MSQVLDFSDDAGFQELHRLSGLYEFPDYVKQAGVAELRESPELPSTIFADSRRRKFASGTRASCWLSWLAFLENSASPSGYFDKMSEADRRNIETRLTRFATALAISGDVDQLKEAHARLNSRSLDDLPDSTFAIVRAFEDGGKERQYPLRNPNEIKQAADWLCQHRDALPVQDRRVIARKILDRADETATSLSAVEDEVMKLAGLGTGPAATIASGIRTRLMMIREGEPTPEGVRIADGLNKLAEIFSTDSPKTADPALRERVVEILDNFDGTYRLKAAYASGRLTRPEELAYPHSVREIDTFNQDLCELPNGAIYRKSDFSKIAVSEVRALLGDDFAEEVHAGLGVDPEKLAEAAVILPRPDLTKLSALLADAGVRPVMAVRPQTPGMCDDLRV